MDFLKCTKQDILSALASIQPISKYACRDHNLYLYLMLCIYSGSPTVPRGSPVSVYLFPGEAPKLHPCSLLEEEDSELDGLVATATEAQADMMSEEGSEGSTDNDDFCILEAPGMGIPVSLMTWRAVALFHQ